MAWIEVHQELFSHPKVARTAKVLKKDYATTLGYLVSLWLWAAAYARDGELSGFSNDEIATACNADGGLNIKKALQETQWIDEKDGKLSLHDWKKHGVRILEESKRRMRKSRRERALEEKTVMQQSQNSVAYLSLFLSNLSILSVPVDHPIRSEEFAKAWDDWYEFRLSEKKKRLGPVAARKQLTFLVKQPDPVECIEQAIRGNWQGIFEVKGRQGGKRSYSFDRSKYPTL